MEAIIKNWYEYLKQDKIMGMRCKECGAVEFPPVPVSNCCSSTEMEWVEMSGEGELKSFSLSIMGVYPYNTTPSVAGYARLKEGMDFIATIKGVGIQDQGELLKKLSEGPVKVKMVTDNIDEEFKFPFFELV